MTFIGHVPHHTFIQEMQFENPNHNLPLPKTTHLSTHKHTIALTERFMGLTITIVYCTDPNTQISVLVVSDHRSSTKVLFYQIKTRSTTSGLCVLRC